MRVKLLLVTLAIKLVKATDSKIKPSKPVLPGITNAGVGKPSKVWIKYHAVPDAKNQLDGYRSGSKSMLILFMHVTYGLTCRQ